MRAIKTVTATACVAVTLPILATVTTPGEANAGGCPNVKSYAVGGVGDPTSSHVPGAPSNAERIHYSASVFPVGGVIGEQSKNEAQRKLDRSARAFRKACPNSQVNVYGYSLGALAAGDTRDSWNNDRRMNKRTKFILVADARSKNGALTQLPAEIIGFRKPWKRPSSRIPTSSVCRTNDAICNIGNPIANPAHAINAIAGYALGDHLYTSREVNPAPGNHWVRPKKVAPVIRPAAMPAPAPVAAPAPTPVKVEQFIPEPVKQYVPEPLREVVIPQVVLPPVPVIKLPEVKLPPLPKIVLPKIG